MNTTKFFEQIDIEKVAKKIGTEVIENDPLLREAGIRLNEFDEIDIIVMGLDDISKRIDLLMQDLQHRKEEGE